MHLPDAWGYVVFADEAVDLFSCGAVVMGFERFQLSDSFWYITYNLYQFVYDLESSWSSYTCIPCYLALFDGLMGKLCLIDFLHL